MKTKLLVSAAAIAMLMVGGVASAQSPGGGARGESPAVGAGGSSAGSSGMSAPSGAAETGKSDAVEPRGSQGGKNAQDQRAPNTRSQKAEDGKAGKSPAAHTATDSKNGERMNKNSASDSKAGAEGKTTGNAATAAKGAPPAEKRTQISSAIKKEKVTAVTNVNFNISVGTRVPASVRFYPVPVSVIAIYPEWEGYEFILVGGRYVIVAPETHEIVYILT